MASFKPKGNGDRQVSNNGMASKEQTKQGFYQTMRFLSKRFHNQQTNPTDMF